MDTLQKLLSASSTNIDTLKIDLQNLFSRRGVTLFVIKKSLKQNNIFAIFKRQITDVPKSHKLIKNDFQKCCVIPEQSKKLQSVMPARKE